MKQDGTVRPAAIGDLLVMTRMAAHFFATSGLDKWFGYKQRCFSQVCANFIESDQAVILVGEGQTGVIAMAAALA